MQKRRLYLIDRGLQYGFLTNWVLSVLVIILLCVFYLLMFQVFVPTESRPSTEESLGLIMKLTGVLILMFVVIMGINSIIHSHRIAGPAYNIRRTVDSLVRGEAGVRVKLRDRDYLQDLAESVNALADRLAGREKDLHEAASELVRMSEDEALPEAAREQLRRLADRLGSGGGTVKA